MGFDNNQTIALTVDEVVQGRVQAFANVGADVASRLQPRAVGKAL